MSNESVLEKNIFDWQNDIPMNKQKNVHCNINYQDSKCKHLLNYKYKVYMFIEH